MARCIVFITSTLRGQQQWNAFQILNQPIMTESSIHRHIFAKNDSYIDLLKLPSMITSTNIANIHILQGQVEVQQKTLIHSHLHSRFIYL